MDTYTEGIKVLENALGRAFYQGKMRLPASWSSLKPFGFNALTGEADAMSFRMLVDLNDSAMSIMSQYLGGIQYAQANYNSGSSASLLISHNLVPEILMYSVIVKSLDFNLNIACSINGNNVSIYNTDSPDYKRPRGERLYQIHSTGPRRGTANIHATSGRAAR